MSILFKLILTKDIFKLKNSLSCCGFFFQGYNLLELIIGIAVFIICCECVEQKLFWDVLRKCISLDWLCKLRCLIIGISDSNFNVGLIIMEGVVVSSSHC